MVKRSRKAENVCTPKRALGAAVLNHLGLCVGAFEIKRRSLPVQKRRRSFAQEQPLRHSETAGFDTGYSRGARFVTAKRVCPVHVPLIICQRFCALDSLLPSRTAIWPFREKSTDSPRMRAASCGAWKPVEFSASTKSR